MSQRLRFETVPRADVIPPSTHQWDISVDINGQIVDARPPGSTLSIDSIECRRWTKVWNRAANVMGSADQAWQWLTTISKDINGLRPIDVMSTFEGCEILINLLFVIEFGFNE